MPQNSNVWICHQRLTSIETHNILAYFSPYLLLKDKSAPWNWPYTSTRIKQCLCQFIPTVSQYYNKPTNDQATQHIFIDVKRQLHVSATKQSHHQAVNKGKKKGNITTAICSLISQTLQYTVLQKYKILKKNNFWDVKLQTGIVHISSLISFTYSLMVATIHSHNMCSAYWV